MGIECMSYQLLVSTMNRCNSSLYEAMNIHSDAIMVNQTDKYEVSLLTKGNNKLEIYSFAERGVGLSRNTALMRASADIVEFADDDMIFTDTHQADVLREFEEHPEADAILFSLESLNPKRPLLKIKHFGKVSKMEALKYGCARLAVRREKIIYNNITFSLLFGGGATYGSGEDTLFLQDCIRAGMKVYKSPIKVADVKQDSSSWFDGYTSKYYLDKGALFAAALPKLCYVYAFITAMKSHSSDFGKFSIFKMYVNGIRNFKKKQ
ncbi:MAG: glycosyltransferase family A protein [Lachnospiraceae bacterium]